MAGQFDPYHRWLGIPAKDQPPHHYRLLGLELFEADANVIESAADRQMAHVRTFQGGKHSAASQRLLNELAAAKIALLSPHKKAAYDAQLRARLAGQHAVAGPPPLPPAVGGAAVAPPAPPPLPACRPPPLPTGATAGPPPGPSAAAPPLPAAAAPPLPPMEGGTAATGPPAAPAIEPQPAPGSVPLPPAVLELATPAPHPHGYRRPQSARGRPKRLVAWGFALGVLAVGLYVLYTEGLRRFPEYFGSQADRSTDSHGPGRPSGKDGKKEKGPHPGDSPKDHSSRSPGRSPPAEKTPQPKQPEPPQTKLAETPEPSPPAKVEQQPLPPPETPKAAPKLPVPEPSEQKNAARELRKIFAQEYAQATTPSGKLALAKALLEAAQRTSSEPAARFVMLQEALNSAAEAGELTVCRDALVKLEAEYAIDAWTLRLAALGQLGRTARTPEARAAVAVAALQTIDPAIAEDQYETAEKLASLALAAAMKTADVELRNMARDRRDEVRAAQKSWDEVRAAFATLTAAPDDPAANLAAGKYRCFVRQDWQRGLPHLAKGSDAPLKALAEADLARPATPDAQLKLADQWWDWGESAAAADRSSAQHRAAHWYARAEPHLQGLRQAHAAKRLKEAGVVVDLLSLVQPKRMPYVGYWQWDGRTLTSPAEDWPRIQFPYTPAEAYEVTAVVERLPGKPGAEFGRGGLILGLSGDGRQFVALLDGQQPDRRQVSCLLLCDGQSESGNPSLRPHGHAIQPRQAATVVCTVRRSGVTATINGVKVLDWQGSLKQLSLPPQCAVIDSRQLFIGSRLSSFRISRLEVRPIAE